MGGYAGMIGKYRMHMHDSVMDHVKRSQPFEYYENFKVNCDFIVKEDSGIWSDDAQNEEVEYSLLKFGKVKKLRKYYEFDWDFSLDAILWEELKSRNIPVVGYCYVRVHVDGGFRKDDIWNYYYLTSDIGAEEITLSSTDHHLHYIENYNQFIWLFMKGFVFSHEIRE